MVQRGDGSTSQMAAGSTSTDGPGLGPTRVWVRAERDSPFARCLSVGRPADQPEGHHYYQVEGSGELLRLAATQLVPANESNDHEDPGSLDHMSEPTLLALVKQRFMQGSAHTWIGPRVLLAVKPQQAGGVRSSTTPLSETQLAAQADADPTCRPPHPFAAAEAVYRRLCRSAKPQALVMVGERGAGKSHQFDDIVRYLCRRGSKGSAALEAALLGSCNALAAVGSAPQPANSCASQFSRLVQVCGRAALLRRKRPASHSLTCPSRHPPGTHTPLPTLVQLHFDDATGALREARLRCFGLNTCRVPLADGQPFRVFSLLLAAPPRLAGQLHLGNGHGFHYLGTAVGSQSVSTGEAAVAKEAEAPAPADRDVQHPGDGVETAELEAWQQSLAAVGIADQEQMQLLRALAGILHVGELKPSRSPDHSFAHLVEDDASLQVGTSARRVPAPVPAAPAARLCSRGPATVVGAQLAAQLLELEPAALAEALTQRTLRAYGDCDFGRYAAPLYPDEAVGARDALARAVFSRVFSRIAQQADASLRDPTRPAGANPPPAVASLLDLAGLERGSHVGLEELCANYCLEKQHHLLLQAVLGARGGARQASLTAEQQDSQTILGLFEQVPLGLLRAIDQHAKAPGATDSGLSAQLAAAHARNPRWCEQRDGFLVRHLAGNGAEIMYDPQGFRACNDDAVPWDLKQLLSSSTCVLLQGTPESGAGPERSSVCQNIMRQMSELMGTLSRSDCAFLVCVRPCAPGAAGFEERCVMEQLRLLGAVAIAKHCHSCGCSLRCGQTASRLQEAVCLHGKLPDALRDLSSSSPEVFCATLARACGLKEERCFLVDDQLFFPSGLAPLLERLDELSDAEAVPPLHARLLAFGQLAEPAQLRGRDAQPNTPTLPASLSDTCCRLPEATTAADGAAPSAAEHQPSLPQSRQMLPEQRALTRQRSRVHQTMLESPDSSPHVSQSESGPSTTEELHPKRLLQRQRTVPAVAAQVDGRQMLSSMLQLRMWSPRGAVWAPFTCMLLADGEMLLMHMAHPPYSASISVGMLTGIGSVPEPDGQHLLLRLLGQQVVMRSTDPDVVAQWEEVLSQRMEDTGFHEAEKRMDQKVPWKSGPLRISSGATAGPEHAAMCTGALMQDGVLQVRDQEEEGAKTHLSLPLTSLLSARPLPPFSDLELEVDGGRKHVLHFADDEDMLSWMGSLLVLLPSFKPAQAVVDEGDPADPSPAPPRLEKRASDDLSESSGGLRRSVAGSTKGVGGSGDVTNRFSADGGDSMLMVGALQVFVERAGAQRWVPCNARLDAMGVLRITSTHAWGVQLQLPLRTATSILKLGSAGWPYIRVQMPSQLIYVQAQGDVALRQWVHSIQRVSGLHAIFQEHAAWVDLRVEGAGESRASIGPLTSVGWKPTFLVLLSNHQLMCFRSEYSPLCTGCLDLHSAVSIKKLGKDESAKILELRTLSESWFLYAKDLHFWQRHLTSGLEVCRREAEAQRLINLSLKQGSGLAPAPSASEQQSGTTGSGRRSLPMWPAATSAPAEDVAPGMEMATHFGWLRVRQPDEGLGSMSRRRFCVVRARFSAESKVKRTTLEMYKNEKAASQHAGARTPSANSGRATQAIAHTLSGPGRAQERSRSTSTNSWPLTSTSAMLRPRQSRISSWSPPPMSGSFPPSWRGCRSGSPSSSTTERSRARAWRPPSLRCRIRPPHKSMQVRPRGRVNRLNRVGLGGRARRTPHCPRVARASSVANVLHTLVRLVEQEEGCHGRLEAQVLPAPERRYAGVLQMGPRQKVG